MDNFDSIKKVYFLGVGGIGVSAIARMFMLEGKEVWGSDTAHTDLTIELEKEGAKIFIGQDVSNIPENIDLVIYSIALKKFAPEFMKQVREKIKNVISYPEALSIISKNKYTIAICGTHGKTTTVAMVAKIMIDAGLDPTVIVGSILKDYKTNFIAGKSKPARMPSGEAGGYLVVEACEYCRSFLEINPTVIGITNIDKDHLDYYKDESDIVNAFKEFVVKVPEEGAVVGNMKDEKIADVMAMTTGKNIDTKDFYDQGLNLKVPGEHNKKNASIALAIADFLDIPKKSALESLINFSGTWRRFEYKGKIKNGAIVYDDYAHHPAEIEATISGAREMFPDKNITVVFQPHLYSRTKLLLDEFAESLSKADYVILVPIYAAREENDKTISSDILASKIAVKNDNVVSLDNFEEAKKELLESTTEKDIVIIMGAGDIAEIAESLEYEK